MNFTNYLHTAVLLLLFFFIEMLARSKWSIFKAYFKTKKSIGDLDIVELKKVFKDGTPVYATLTGLSLAIIILLFSARRQFHSDFVFGQILFFLFISFLSFFLALEVCHTASMPYFRDKLANVRLLKRVLNFYLFGIYSLGISMMLCLLNFSETLFYVCVVITILFVIYHIRR